MLYERRKHDGSLPIVGVNTFVSEGAREDAPRALHLIRSTEEEKRAQVAGVRAFQARNADRAAEALASLQRVATSGGNLFAELMYTVRSCSLGQISRALYEVGGRYRRNM